MASTLSSPLSIVDKPELIGIIGGSNLLASNYFKNLESFTVNTMHGDIKLYRNKYFIFCQRHHSEDKSYIPPHLINKIAFGSVGTLKTDIYACGRLVLPDDWFNLNSIVSSYKYAYDGHIVPTFDISFRNQLIEILQAGNFNPIINGIYAQTTGPRFETKAEIKFLSQYADIVGMTCANEADLANELKIPYALICMVDNCANGLNPSKPDFEFSDFAQGVKKNQVVVERCIDLLINKIIPDFKNEHIVSSLLEVDLIVHAAYIVPIIPEIILENHSLVVNSGKIVAIIPTDKVASIYKAKEVVNSGNAVLMPGLINMHTHLGMSYLRGFADDEPLAQWLQESIWPAEEQFVNSEFVEDGVALGVAEMIRSGTTCANDMYWFPESTYSVCKKSGFRMALGLTAMDFPTSYAKNFDEYIEKAKETYLKLKGDPLLKFSIAPHAPYTVSDENLSKCKKFSDEYDVNVHIHLHETLSEALDSECGTPSMAKHRSEKKCRPFENLDSLGLLNNKLIAVHMTQMNYHEIVRAGKVSINVVHCPCSNLKLASGFCPIAGLTRAGVNVCIGTDSTASNNSLDMFNEMRIAAMLAKAVDENAASINAYTALKMVTINGAKALGWDKEIGSLEVGKSADFIAVSLTGLEYIPLYSVISHLVYIADRHAVQDVWVSGQRLLSDRKLCTLDYDSIYNKSILWGKKLKDFQTTLINKKKATIKIV